MVNIFLPVLCLSGISFYLLQRKRKLKPKLEKKKKLILVLGLVLMPTSRHSEKELFCVRLETECVKETELVAYCISSHFHATNDDRTLF